MATSPFTQDDLDEISRIANIPSEYPTVFDRTLCRTGAVLRIHASYHDTIVSLLQASGYTVQTTSKHTLVVTAAIDEVALLDAQIAALAARREKLLADRPLDDLVEAF